MPTTASADFSQFVVTTANGTVCETSRDKPVSLSSSTCLIYAHGLRLPFWTSLRFASLSTVYALYQVSVRQATISLSLLLACTSRCKPWESLSGSTATTPLVDSHHRLTACPSYKNSPLPPGSGGPGTAVFNAGLPHPYRSEIFFPALPATVLRLIWHRLKYWQCQTNCV